jgi:TonB family protein
MNARKNTVAPVLVMLVLAGMMFFPQGGTAQVMPQDKTGSAGDSLSSHSDDEKIFEKVEIEASFPGGDNAWRRFLEQNVNGSVPTIKGAPAGTYTVMIQFVVDRDGKVSDIKPLTSHGYGMEAEVIRLLRKAPRWEPAFQDGRNVRAYRKQPVTFMVTEEEKKKKKNKG